MLDTAKVKGVTKKLLKRYKGPYSITLVVDDANYKINTLNGKKLMVNKARLKRCFPRRFLLDLDIDDSGTAMDRENVSPSNKSDHIDTGKTVSEKNINKKVSFKDGKRR